MEVSLKVGCIPYALGSRRPYHCISCGRKWMIDDVQKSQINFIFSVMQNFKLKLTSPRNSLPVHSNHK